MSTIQWVGFPKFVGWFTVKYGFNLNNQRLEQHFIEVTNRKTGRKAMIEFGTVRNYIPLNRMYRIVKLLEGVCANRI